MSAPILAGPRPLAATLARAVAAGAPPCHDARGGVPAGARPVAAAVRDHGVDALVDRRARAHGLTGVAGDVAAGFVFADVAWAVAVPAITAVLLDGRAPTGGHDDVLLAYGADGRPVGTWFPGPVAVLPDDPVAGADDATVVADHVGLARVVAGVLADVLAPVIEVVRPHGRRSTRTLWSEAGDTVAHATVVAANAGAIEWATARATADEVLGHLADHGCRAPDWRRIDTRVGPRHWRRRTSCCLWYRAGADTCSTCPLTAEDVAIERLGAWFERGGR